MYKFFKRLLDIVGGTILFIISLPIILITAIIVRVESKGSPFFFQTRIGLRGKPFKIFKLRGMFVDARERFPELYDYSANTTLDFHFHYEHDPRVTKTGHIIRKYSIDELPNFFNVIMGDMSLVGPRPEIPDILQKYEQFKEEYISVKPGITCASKISGRDTLTKLETIELDLNYIRTRTFKKDIHILLATFTQVILKKMSTKLNHLSGEGKPGKFISFEGIDGAGKSSHIAWLREQLTQYGISVVSSREPGGTPLGEKLREIILNDEMQPATEALLAFAARQENVLTVIQPALTNGQWVLCDRFTDSTFAYQGYGRNFPLEKLVELESWVHADLQPTLTIIFDCDPAVAAQRLADARVADKFERQSVDFFTRVRDGYLTRAAQYPQRYAIINSNQSMEAVRDALSPLVEKLLKDQN